MLPMNERTKVQIGFFPQKFYPNFSPLRIRVGTLSCLKTNGITLPYFGFTSNEIPHYGPAPILTYFILNPPVMSEPGTEQTRNQMLLSSHQLRLLSSNFFFQTSSFPLSEVMH